VSISDDEIRQAISETFRIEADEHIQAINRLLLRLEQGAVQDLNACLDEIAREAHTLKGGASILGLTLIQETAHCMEEVFEVLRDASRETPPELFDLLYSALDRLAIGCQRVEDPEGADAEALERLQAACQRYAAEISGKPTRVPVEAPSLPIAPVIEVAPPPPSAPPPPEVALEPVAPAPPAVPDIQHELAVPSPAVAATAHEAEPLRAGEETIRIPIRKLDSLMAQIGELLIAKIRNDERLQEIRDLALELEDANKDWGRLKDVRRALASASTSGSSLRTLRGKHRDLLDRMESHLKAISHRVGAVVQEFSRDTMRMSILTENLQEDIKKARMLPVSTILDGFHRLVRDVARKENKQAVLELRGTETEVDKRVLELMKDPLMHLLRNAVSHGIEPPAERLAAGKDPTGVILVRTQQVGGHIQIEIDDDGAGIDVNRVVDRAIERGLIDAIQARSLTSKEALQLIFHSGLSTKEAITDISGRGVGMDVVRENVQRVQGQITIDTTPGSGTSIVITLPLTLSTTKCLLVEVGRQVFALPIHSVERILRITASEVRAIEDMPALVLGGVPVAVARLADILGVTVAAPAEDDPKMPVVILNVGERRLGLIVDSLVDEQEMVVKPLGKQLVRVRNVAGGTIVGSGAVILVLNPLDLVRSGSSVRGLGAATGDAASLAESRSRKGERQRIVIAEDSITTRTLEKNILETAGYEVVACKDGLEALRYLQSATCDALVTDINMPNMDGFTLIERVRQMGAFRDLPIIMVTSFGSDEDKRRGMQVGANGYIVKGDFEQTRFLEMLRQFI
jgi:two-component system chemotaxis sensor kinase CheA